MKPKELDAKQLAEQLMTALGRVREHLDERDWDIFEEGIRRIREHEVLLAEVIHELRTRLAVAEENS
jgi:signal transduction histidine kinase